MKTFITLATIFVLMIGCSEAPFQPSSETLVGSRWAKSTVIYHGEADEPIEVTTIINIVFDSDGTFEYIEYNNLSNIMPHPNEPIEGSYVIEGNSITLTVDFNFWAPSPMQLEGTFDLELTETSLSLHQVIGDEFPEIHSLQSIPEADAEPLLFFIGYWEGSSTVTYYDPLGLSLKDILEIQFNSFPDGRYNLNVEGNLLTDPLDLRGTYRIEAGNVILSPDYEEQDRSPLNLKGDFTHSIDYESLGLMQPSSETSDELYEVSLNRIFVY